MFRLFVLAVPVAVLAALPAAAEKPQGPPSIVEGNNDFAFDLYAQLAKKDGNLFFSPYSISAALAMTSAGARNQTLAEMEKALHFPAQEKLHPAFADLIKQINGAGSSRPIRGSGWSSSGGSDHDRSWIPWSGPSGLR